MFCVRTKEQILQFFSAVSGQLKEISSEKYKYDIEEAARSLYDMVLEKSNNSELAMTYVSMLPQVIMSITSISNEIADYFVDNNISLDKINKLRKQWSTLEGVKEFLKLQDSSEVKADIIASFEEVSNSNPSFTSEDDYDELEKSDIIEYNNEAKRYSPIGSTGQEAIDENSGIPDTEDISKLTYYNAQRNIKLISKKDRLPIKEIVLKSNTPGVSSVKGVYAKLVHSSEITDEKYLRLKTIQNNKQNEPGVYIVLSDSDGNILYFTPKGELTNEQNGIPAITFLNKPTLNSKNEYELKNTYKNESRLIEPAELAARESVKQNVPFEQLYKMIQDEQQKELKLIYDLREYIINTKKSVLVDITKISSGQISMDIKNPTKLSNIKSNLSFDVALGDLNNKKSGGVYFSIEGSVENVLVVRPNVPENIADVITNLVKIKSTDLKTVENVKNYIETLVYTSPKNLGIFVNKKDNEFYLNVVYNKNNTGLKKELSKTVVTLDVNNPLSLEVFKSFLINQKKLNINKDKIDNKFTTFNLVDGKLQSKVENYNDFIKNNFLTYLQPNENGEFLPLNSYLELDVPIDYKEKNNLNQIKNTITKTKEELEKVSNNNKQRLSDLNKLKTIINKATPKQIEEAKTWWDKSPISKTIDFHQLFDVVNSDAFGTFTESGITLFNGANYTDLYHEAFHAFSQLFLTVNQKIELYEEIKKLNGSFKDFSNNEIEFKNASYLQVEEFLAEDFRKYILSNRTIILDNRPVRNNIFRRIFKFLKYLFENVSGIQLLTTPERLQNIYDNLYKGRLNSYSKSTDNMMFGKLNSIKAKNYNFTAAETKIILDSFDGLIRSILEDVNKPITLLYENNQALPIIYKEIKNHFESLLIDDTISDSDKLLASNIINNFKDVVDYHNKKSKYLSKNKLIESLFDSDGNINEKLEEGDDSDLNLQYRDITATKNGNEQSIKEMANNETLYLLQGLFKVDNKGNKIYNELKAPLLVDFDKTWNRVIKATEGSTSRKHMFNKLINLAEQHPEFNQLVNYLGDPEDVNNSLNDLKWSMWSKFYQDMDKTRVPLNILFTKKDENNNLIISLSEANPAVDIVKRDFSTYFSQLKVDDKNYVYLNEQENNVLNVNKLIKDFAVKVGKNNNYSIKEEDKIKFLKAIGFDIDNEVLEIRQELFKIRTEDYNYLLKGIILFHEKNIELTNPVEQLSKPLKTINYEGNTARINKILTIQAKYSDSYSNYSVVNPNGDREYEHMLNNYFTKIANKFNDFENYSTYSDIQNDESLVMFNIDKNPFIKDSIWLNSVFNIDVPAVDKDGNINKDYGQRRKNPDGSFVTINISNYSGIKSADESLIEGEKTTNLSSEAKFTMDLHSLLLHGVMELPRHASKSSAFAITPSTKYNKQYDEFNNEQKLYIGFKDVIISENKIPNALNKLLKEYLKTELTLISNFKFRDIGKDLAIYKDYADEFRFFDDIITDKQLKDKLISESEDLSNIDNVIKKYKNELERDFNNYFFNLVEIDKKQYLKYPLITKELQDKVKSFDEYGLLEKNSDTVNTIIRAYTYNSWINFAESIKFFYGDLAYFKTLKEEFHKRNTGYSATGSMPITDDAALNRINSKGRHFAMKRLGDSYTHIPFTKKVKTTIFEDPKVAEVSKYVKEYEPIFKEHYLKLTGSEETANLLTKIALKPYSEMTEADGQGYISLDFYRAYKDLLGQWSGEQERLYQEVIHGSIKDSNLSEEEQKKLLTRKVGLLFPPIKLQYLGPITHDKLAPPAFYKFSVVPLTPGIIKNTQFEEMNDRLMQQGIDIALFGSGSKLSSVLNEKGELEQFYTQNRDLNKSDNFNINEIFLDYLKEQVKIEPKFKEEVIFSTQLRKLIESALFNEGIAVSDTLKNLANEYNNNISLYTSLLKDNLLKELGVTYENNDYNIKDFKPIVTLLHKELNRRDLPENVIDYIDLDEKGNIKYPLDLSTRVQVIETMLQAIVNNRLVKQHFNGEPLIQVASTGFEVKDSLNKYTNPTEEDLKKWGDNDLPFYNRNKETKLTDAAKCKVALTGDFIYLLELDSVKKRAEEKNIEPIDALNELIKEDDWLNSGNNRKLITLTGVRIPVQGANSMEFMEVYQFLPEHVGNIMILPTGIVAKSGGDYDIDKLNIFRPNISLINGKVVYFDKNDNYTYRNNEDLVKHFEPLLEQAEKNKKEYSNIFDRLIKNLNNPKLPLNESDKQKIIELKDDFYSNKNSLERQRDVALKIYLNRLQNKIKSTEEETNLAQKEVNNLNNEIESLEEQFYSNLDAISNTFKNEIYNEEYLKELRRLSKIKQDLYNELRSLKDSKLKSVQNSIIENIRNILEQPELFVDLVRPNDTSLAKPIADALEEKVATYNSRYSVSKKDIVYKNKKTKDVKTASELTSEELKSKDWNRYVSPTRILESAYNLYKLTSNNEGKAVLGILAISNTFHALYKKIGAVLNNQYYSTNSKGEVTINDLKILLPTNKKVINGVEHVSLSHTYSVDKVNKIADVISQLMNGTVDVEKDAWVSNLNTNLEASPISILLILAGTPLPIVSDFVTKPIILEYSRKLKGKTNIFDKILNPEKHKNFKKELRIELFNKLGVKNKKGESLNLKNFNLKDLDIELNEDTVFTDAAASLLHFIQLEQIAGHITSLQKAFNVDTNKTSSSFAANQKIKEFDEILATRIIPEEFINKLKNETILKNFFVQELGIKMFRNLLPLRYNSVINKYIDYKLNSAVPFIKRSKVAENFGRTFKNDLMLYLFQNTVLKSYSSVDSNLNNWFKGSNNMASRLYTIKNKYKEQLKDYVLLNDLKSDKPKEIKKDNLKNVTNIKISKPLNDSDLVNLYAEEFERLINKDVIKSNIPEENEEITKFFRDLAVFGFLQSGLNKSPISFTEILPPRVYLGIMRGTFEHFVKNINSVILDDFFSKFESNNPNFFAYNPNAKQETYRLKDYMSNLPLEDLKGRDINIPEVKTLPSSDEVSENNSDIEVSNQSTTVTQSIDFQEEPTSGYRNRTIKNASADATIAFAVDFTTPGEKLTKNAVLEQGKKYIPVNTNDLNLSSERTNGIIDRLNSVNAKTLNIAGNGIYTMKGKYTQEQIDEFTYQLLKAVIESPRLINKITSIRSGGQTGFDEAGAKAGIRLGIPTTVLAPKGWLFRNIDNIDIDKITKNSSEAKKAFIDRFNSVQPTTQSVVKPTVTQGDLFNQSIVNKKGFKLSIDKKGKDQGKADLANAFISYPNTGTSSYQYLQDAKKQGIPVNNEIKANNNTIAFVSVNGNNKATNKQIEDTILAAREVIELGGTVIMDSTYDANRSWNKSGEALVQEQLGEPTGQTSKGYNYWGKNPELNNQSDINTLWNENKDVILSKNPDTTFEVIKQGYEENGLEWVKKFIDDCKKGKIK